MSFKEFDMSEYLQVLEQFKAEHSEDMIKHWGSEEEYDKFINKIRDNETEVAKIAIKQYGSIEKYTEAMKENMSHFSENVERLQSLTASNNYLERNKALYAQLVADITKDVDSKDVQDVVQEIMMLFDEVNSGMNMGENFWDMVIDGYLHDTTLIEANDKLYGTGASEFMGKALQCYFDQRKVPEKSGGAE